MRAIFSLLLFLYLPLQAQPVFALRFSDAELQRIERQQGSDVRRRIDDFLAHIVHFKTLTKERQIIEVNTFINGYLPEFDSVINREEDRWSTPKEFLKVGYGDCEEYAIAKYYTLIELGFREEDLCLTVVKDLYSGGYHMVLCYFPGEGRSPLVLDNLSFRVLQLLQRSDLQVQYCMNAKGLFSVMPGGSRNKLNARDAKFDDLIKRIDAGR